MADPQDKSDENFYEDAKPIWPFSSDEEEDRYFDNLQRARDVRSS